MLSLITSLKNVLLSSKKGEDRLHVLVHLVSLMPKTLNQNHKHQVKKKNMKLKKREGLWWYTQRLSFACLPLHAFLAYVWRCLKITVLPHDLEKLPIIASKNHGEKDLNWKWVTVIPNTLNQAFTATITLPYW